MTNAPLLTSLPPEILLHIAEHLRARELVHLSRTCRALKHIGECENFALVLMRSSSAEEAICNLQCTNSRMDLIAELFRHVENRKRWYPCVAETAGRLGDVEQLEAWRGEFGFTPSQALQGAIQSGRIETFERVLSLVELTDAVIDKTFDSIGFWGNKPLLDHYLENRPEWVTPERLEMTIKRSAFWKKLQFARGVFDSLRSRTGVVPINSARYIINAAAEVGNVSVFSEFIAMTEFSADDRNEFAESAVRRDQVEILRFQEESIYAADSLDLALFAAVDFNAIDALRYLLEIEDRNRSFNHYLIQAFMMAVDQHRSEMLPLLMPKVSRGVLLRGVAISRSHEVAVVLLKEYQKSDREQVVEDAFLPEYEFEEYSANFPDWRMTVWLVVYGLDNVARLDFTDIEDDERARFLSVLPSAIDLARELNLDDAIIDEMTRFAHRQM